MSIFDKNNMMSIMEGYYNENNIPFQPAALTEIPSKPRTRITMPERDKEGDSVNMVDDMGKQDEAFDIESTEPKEAVSDVVLIQSILDKIVTLYDGNDIKVLYRAQTEKGVLYDVYFQNNHTILYVQPDNDKVFLINRSMDEDHFADVLEDIQEMDVDIAERHVGKDLITISRTRIEPPMPEPALSDIDDVADDLDELDVGEIDGKEPVTNPVDDDLEDIDAVDDEGSVDDEIDDDELYLDDDPQKDESDDESDDEYIEKDFDEALIQNYKIIKEESMSKTVKDIINDYGYEFISTKNEVLSLSEYLHNEDLKKFGSFFIRLKDDDYYDIYGMAGTRIDEKNKLISVMESGKMVFDKDIVSNLNEEYVVGEVVKIDLRNVDGKYLRNINIIANRTQGRAIVESIGEDVIYVAENTSQAKIKGGVPINLDAVIKIENIVTASTIYEDSDINIDYDEMVNEKKQYNLNIKKEEEKKLSNIIPESIMDLSFFKK